MKQSKFISRQHFLAQKPFKPFISTLNDNSLNEIDKLILTYNKNVIINLKKEMIVNLLKYNVDGDWVKRIEDSKLYKRATCSLEGCIVRYGEVVGNIIYKSTIDKTKPNKSNYTKDEWSEICKKKISNLGINGYIRKYGKDDGEKKWNNYQSNWKIGIEKRKKSGKWKNGRSLNEFQLKYGLKEGYRKWRIGYDKRNHTLSMNGFIERFGEISGKEKYFQHITKMIKNCRSGAPYSKISQELFDAIYKLLSTDKQNCVKYFTLNEEQQFIANGTYGINVLYTDFKCGNIVIEFDGGYWHSFPAIKSKDINKTRYLESIGYKVLRISEQEYIKNKQETVEKCVNYINENYKN